LTNFTGLNRRPSSTGRLFGLSPGEIAQAIATVDNVSLACMNVEPVSQWKGFSPGMTGMRAVYAVSLAKRGFTGPRGMFEGFAPDPSVIALLESLDGGLAIIEFSLQIDAQIWIGQGGGHEATGHGIGNTLVSVCGNSAFARANSALRIDKYHRWLA